MQHWHDIKVCLRVAVLAIILGGAAGYMAIPQSKFVGVSIAEAKR